jgi:hypothetical protein
VLLEESTRMPSRVIFESHRGWRGAVTVDRDLYLSQEGARDRVTHGEIADRVANSDPTSRCSRERRERERGSFGRDCRDCALQQAGQQVRERERDIMKERERWMDG